MRPLSIGEILDAGIKVVLRHWKPFVTCIAGLVLPAWILFMFLLASIDPEAFEIDPETGTTTEDPDATLLVGFLITAVVFFATFMIGFVACFKVVTDAWLGNKPEVKRSLGFGLRRSPMALLLGIIMSIALFPAFLACLIPGIYLAVIWAVALPALLVERGGPFKALGRSFNLIKGRWWATFALVLVGYLLVSIVGSVLQGVLVVIAGLAAPESLIVNAAAQVVGYTVSSVITYPYYATVITILYFDQRVRKEGFDIQLMAEGLGVERDPNAQVPDILAPPPVMYTPEQRAAAPYWPPPPGWQPPPPSGEAPPAGAPAWDPPTADRQLEERPPEERPPEERPPGESPWMSPSSEPPPPPKADEEENEPKRDRGRADWQPPEAPRGPGGL